MGQFSHFHLYQSSKDISDSRGRGDIICQQASSHGYNTRSKVKKPDMVQGINVNVVPNTPKSNPKVMPSQGQAKTKVKPVQGQTKTKKVEQDAGGLSHTPAELRKKQLDDPDISSVLKWKESGNWPFGQEVCLASAATRHYWNCWDLLQVENGVLMRRFVRQDATGDHLQFVVPRSMHSEILQQVHNSLLGGHLGQKKTREKVLQRFYWSGVHEDCNIWVAKCDECAKVKHPPRRPRAPLGEMLVGAPLDRLATDILGPFPESTKGNKYILGVTDYFTKWVEIYAIPDQSAVTCAEVILDEFIG